MRLMANLRLQGNCQGEELVNAALAGAAPASMTTRIEFAVAVVRKESSQISVIGKWMHAPVSFVLASLDLFTVL
ncbi:UNVERIFIED_CONTAM: hypothetical protein Sradi_6792300 [Sesamum radiatum]|uniref:Uncharacterized protein n=1 Tax=Sesamum radiatum TaxID=300843 RepID=A0AAW2JSG2_SESRA